MIITLVAGARPNFMKIAPIIHEIKRRQQAGEKIEYRLVHTGQHYDQKLSETFFDELNIPKPEINLEVGSGTHAIQTGNIMIGFEKYLEQNPCDLVIVVGDVNSTLACSIVAKKNQTKVAHVEAGIRSFDYGMPEEINRLVTDSICDYYFTTSTVANQNLKNAGIRDEQVFYVGNTMIDSLVANQSRFRRPEIWDQLKLADAAFLLLTLHRPHNVDDETRFVSIVNKIAGSFDIPIIFPVHPRTRSKLEALDVNHSIHFVEPLGYLEFMYLVRHALAVLTDSGGIQEETTFLGVPCLTIRDNTERPETITMGTNELIGTDPDQFSKYFDLLKSGKWKEGKIPALWDGQTARRIVDAIIQLSF